MLYSDDDENVYGEEILIRLNVIEQIKKSSLFCCDSDYWTNLNWIKNGKQKIETVEECYKMLLK